MNVLILATHMNTGGITSYVMTLAKGLVRAGHSVWVLSSGGDQEDALLTLGAQHVRMDLQTKSEMSPKVFLSIPKIVHFVKTHHIQVIHAQTRVTQVIASVVSRRTGLPYVSTCHGFFKPRFFRKIFPCWGQATIAISPQVKTHLIEDFGCDPQHVFIIPHGLDRTVVRWPEDEKTKKKESLGIRHRWVIGMVARLSEVKGQDILIKAMPEIVAKYSDVGLVLVGEGKTEGALRRLVRDLNIEAHVSFLPFRHNQDQDHILPIFDIFVMPSRQEGLGLSIMEAQIQGLAVVATNVGGIPSVIEDGQTGLLVNKEDPSALAQAIIGLIDDPVRRHTMASQAAAFAQRNFSWEKMIHATADVYQQVYRS